MGMRLPLWRLVCGGLVICATIAVVELPAADPSSSSGSARERGVAKVEESRPKSFPHRIWAACDFEGQTPDYGWVGVPELKHIPAYEGNLTALVGKPKSGGKLSAI